MKFSVLMSVYANDDAGFFEMALRSVTVDQTLKPDQVVIVQDGPVSKEIDDTILEMQDLLPTTEFTIVKKEVNAGLAAALNSGLKACKYDWVARMDSDDISVADRFEKQVDFLLKNPEIDIVGGTIAEFQNEIGDIDSLRKVGKTHAEILAMAKTRTPMNHMSIFYRKNAVIEAGMYSEDFGKLEDYKLWVDMLSSGKKFSNIDDVLVNARIGNGFVERRSNKREIYDWDMLQKYLLQNNFVSKVEALKNKLYIRVFIYTPSWIKKLLYKFILRG